MFIDKDCYLLQIVCVWVSQLLSVSELIAMGMSSELFIGITS